MGRVGRPHGLDGSFHVIDPRADVLVPGARLMVGAEPTEVVGRKGTAGAPILRLAAAADRTAAEALRGAELTVPREAAPPLGEDEYWADDLVGCEVRDGDRSLGTVERMVAYPSCEVLVVGDHLIPLVRDAIADIDLEARRISVRGTFLGL